MYVYKINKEIPKLKLLADFFLIYIYIYIYKVGKQTNRLKIFFLISRKYLNTGRQGWIKHERN